MATITELLYTHRAHKALEPHTPFRFSDVFWPVGEAESWLKSIAEALELLVQHAMHTAMTRET